MAKYILYSDFNKSFFSITTPISVDPTPFSVKEQGGMIWFGTSNKFGKFEKSSGIISYYSVTAGNGVREITISESYNIIILMMLNSASKLVIEIRDLSNPSAILSTYTDAAAGYSGSFDSTNKKIYVACGTLGVKVFNYDSSTHAITVNTTIAIDTSTWYDAKVSAGKLFVSNVSNGTIKCYSIVNGTPVALTFIKDIIALRPQGRGIWFNANENTLFVSHGTASNSVSVYDYANGGLLNENFITGLSQPFGIHVNLLGELLTVSYGNAKILKSV